MPVLDIRCSCRFLIADSFQRCNAAPQWKGAVSGHGVSTEKRQHMLAPRNVEESVLIFNQFNHCFRCNFEGDSPFFPLTPEEVMFETVSCSSSRMIFQSSRMRMGPCGLRGVCPAQKMQRRNGAEDWRWWLSSSTRHVETCYMLKHVEPELARFLPAAGRLFQSLRVNLSQAPGDSATPASTEVGPTLLEGGG